MSRNKDDYVGSEYYAKHLSGFSRFVTNPTKNRKAIIQRMLMRQIGAIAVARFKWVNLPKTVDPRFLEMTLARNALSIFFYSFELGRFLSLQGHGVGQPDMQDNYQHFRVYGNAYTPVKPLHLDFCVPVWANDFRVPDWDIVLIYASRLAEIDTTLEINTKQARRTKIITVDENRRLSYDNIVKQIDEGNPAIKVTEDILKDNAIQALDLGVDPDAITNLHIYRRRVWDELMGALGINNANTDKKERTNADEVNANNDQVAAVRFANLHARKFAVAQINDKFGLDIDVMYASDYAAEHGDGEPPQTDDNMPLSTMGDYRQPQSELASDTRPAITDGK